jgi:uncharacterized protein (DUF362 family)
MKPEKENTTKDDVLKKIFQILIEAGCDVNCGDAVCSRNCVTLRIPILFCK